MGQVSCVSSIRPFGALWGARTLAGRSRHAFSGARQQPRGQEIRTNCLMPRTKCVSLGDLLDSGVAPGEAEPSLDLGDLGATHRHPMRRRTIELDDRAVAFLANQGDMRDRNDVAAVHPDELAGV